MKEESIYLAGKQNIFEGDAICINDVVCLSIKLTNDQIVKQTIKLVAGNFSGISSFPKCISIDSPLGQAILGKQVGDEISYVVNKQKLSAIIETKVDENSLNSSKQQIVKKIGKLSK